MIRRFWFFLLCGILGVSGVIYYRTEIAGRYRLSFESMVPEPGKETEWAMIASTMETKTNLVDGKYCSTNWSSRVELEFKCKTSVWNTKADYCQAEWLVNRFTVCRMGVTNELAKPGDKISVKYLLGQWLFESDLSNEAKDLLGRAFRLYITPREGLKRFDGLQLNQPRAIGESWPMVFNLEDASERNNSIADPTAKFFAGVALAKMNATNLQGSVRFVGMTNISGIEAFDLVETTHVQEEFANTIVDATVTADTIAPFDGSHKDWTAIYRLDDFGFREDKAEATNGVLLGMRISAIMLLQIREAADGAAGG